MLRRALQRVQRQLDARAISSTSSPAGQHLGHWPSPGAEAGPAALVLTGARPASREGSLRGPGPGRAQRGARARRRSRVLLPRWPADLVAPLPTAGHRQGPICAPEVRPLPLSVGPLPDDGPQR